MGYMPKLAAWFGSHAVFPTAGNGSVASQFDNAIEITILEPGGCSGAPIALDVVM